MPDVAPEANPETLPARPDLNHRLQELRARVHAACQSLADAQQRVSTRAVRQTLGGGHPNDINPFVAEWKQFREEQREQMKALNALPPATKALLISKLEPMIAQTWALARESVAADVDRMEQTSDEQQREKDDDIADLKALVNDLQTENERLEAACDQASEDRDAASAAVAVARARCDDAQKSRDTAVAECERLRQSLVSSEANLIAERVRLDSKSQALTQLNDQQLVLQRQLSTMENQFSELVSERDRLRHELKTIQQRQENQFKAVAALRAERDRAEKIAEKHRSEYVADVTAMHKELATLRHQLSAQIEHNADPADGLGAQSSSSSD